MPALILFMAIGMIFGCDGIFKIQFDNYKFAEEICTIALSFIMFYGGLNTKWKTAKTVAPSAVALSTIGVVITAALTCTFCYFALRFSFVESYLIGAVISSTDAASVFSILRKKKRHEETFIPKNDTVIPSGDTLIHENDIVVTCR